VEDEEAGMEGAVGCRGYAHLCRAVVREFRAKCVDVDAVIHRWGGQERVQHRGRYVGRCGKAAEKRMCGGGGGGGGSCGVVLEGAPVSFLWWHLVGGRIGMKRCRCGAYAYI